jgi:hypothetical protein
MLYGDDDDFHFIVQKRYFHFVKCLSYQKVFNKINNS